MEFDIMAKKWECTPEILDKVYELACKGVNESSIARLVGLHPSTFSEKKKEFPELDETIKRATAYGEQVVVGKLWELINSNDKASIMFYLKTRCGWREREDTTIVVDKPSKLKFTKKK